MSLSSHDGIEWPSRENVLLALYAARRRSDGWRTLAEIAGTLQCPDFGRVLTPALELVESGQVERKNERHPDEPTLYRARMPEPFTEAYKQ